MDFIGIENFRSLSGWHKFELADITLLTGTNNSGKSSLISAVRILKDGIQGMNNENKNSSFSIPDTAYQLGSIIAIELNNSGDKRSGGFLSTLINRNNVDKNSFSYIFKGEIDKYINSAYEIMIKFEIHPKNEDRAYISEIVFKDDFEGVEFLKIRQVEQNKVSIKIDFSFFAECFKQLWTIQQDMWKQVDKINQLLKKRSIKNDAIILDKIKEYEREYNVTIDGYQDNEEYRFHYDYILSTPIIINYGSYEKNQIEQLKKGIVFDLEDFLLPDHQFNNDFVRILDYYRKDRIEDAYELFTKDLLNFLSELEFHFKYFERHLDMNEADVIYDCLSFNRIIEYFESTNFPLFHLDSENLFSHKSINNFDELSRRMNEFISNVFEPTLNLLATYKKNKNTIKRSLFEEGIALMIDGVIYDLRKNIHQLDIADFITSSRGLSSATFRNADTGEFQQMLQKLYALDDEKKDVAIWFITKWLKELDIADDFILKVDPKYKSYQACLMINEVELPLNEFGFGTVQLLPLLLGITLHNPSTKNHREKNAS